MSNDVILKAVNVSKQYRLGTVGTGTLSHDLNRFWARIRGKVDPYLQIGAVNDRSAAATSDYVWAIKDINFEVKRGEILGIIGKNGAGKSTLLKILSRVTSPTTGSIKTKGRIASLLEVGTGMHPELTGRENVFLNGAILGMSKTEIASKIDEIVEFSGCQMYIDTPVKRYSSGMRVRLGFAVAAFLEPDILVVDEVLAVGDAEFQKKAIGKMQDISNTSGRTVLFVSHNLGTVKQLCNRIIVLEKGNSIFDGNVIDGIEHYTNISLDNKLITKHLDASRLFKNVNLKTVYNEKNFKNGQSVLLGDQLSIYLDFICQRNISKLTIAFDLLSANNELMAHITNDDSGFNLNNTLKDKKYKIKILTNPILLVPGYYFLNLWIGVGHTDTLYQIKNAVYFHLEQGNYTQRTSSIPKHSKVYLHTEWSEIPNI